MRQVLLRSRFDRRPADPSPPLWGRARGGGRLLIERRSRPPPLPNPAPPGGEGADGALFHEASTMMVKGSAAVRSLMFGPARDIDLGVSHEPRQRAGDEGAGMAGRRDIGTVVRASYGDSPRKDRRLNSASALASSATSFSALPRVQVGPRPRGPDRRGRAPPRTGSMSMASCMTPWAIRSGPAPAPARRRARRFRGRINSTPAARRSA